MKNLLRTRLEEDRKFIDPGLIRATFDFWFSDKDHIRSPFPEYIRNELSENAIERFLDWEDGIIPKSKEEITEDVLVEKFEEIIFEEALKLVVTEDEQLTVLYPFMPRTGDRIRNQSHEGTNSVVVGRRRIKSGDEVRLFLRMRNTESDTEWETEFELPE